MDYFAIVNIQWENKRQGSNYTQHNTNGHVFVITNLWVKALNELFIL